MLLKWKFILTNWINCYKIESSQKEECVTTDSLLNILSHLRKNISLDESKSSLLEAQTIEEFIVEKYPEFKFENGTTEAISEKELYMAASLLLYFVCVNSKNMDVKTAMCSQLSTADQETILKFSQYLMQCSKITHTEVVGAITEACGIEIASGERLPPVTVTETPPALRSLHSEVRRLRAALDAERFDRAYLQDELTSTVARIEALQKEKEQYKLEIVSLKGKISLCYGVEAEARGGEAAVEVAGKFARQIEELELKLLTVQEQLDDVIYEKDTYKTKVEELKKERDKWVSISQDEATRAEQLIEQLEAERRQAVTLRELVAELQQHRRNTAALDTSQLECDDPDASMHSLNNASICSEACANVIEVQLSEERAKIAILKQQIQTLQDQLTELNNKAENEKLSLQAIIAEKDDDIFNLKHRINEEIEDKNKQKSQFDDQCISLNNEINELEQKLKDTNDTSLRLLEEKMEEIKTLQDEKLSLLQSLNNHAAKMDSTIKELQAELDSEKTSKQKLKENYENQLMKLNEKVLNRNNELVELQNNVSQNSEMIEQLHLELRTERDTKEQLANKYHQDIAQLTHERKAVEISLNSSIAETKELQKRLQQNVAVFEEFNKEIDDLKLTNAKILQELDEKDATINTIKIQLQDEIHYKTHLQNELIQLQQAKQDLSNDLESVKAELQQYKKEFMEKDKVIYALDLHLIEAKQAKDNLMEEYRCKCQEVERLADELDAKGREMSYNQREFEHEKKVLIEELRKKDDAISEIVEKLEIVNSEKSIMQAHIVTIENKAETIGKELDQKCNEIIMLKSEYDKYVEVAEKHSKLIETLEKRLESENQRHLELQNNFDTQTSSLLSRLNETEKSIKNYNCEYKKAIEKKELQLQTWKLEVEKMQKVVDSDLELTRKLEQEKDALEMKLGEEKLFREKLEKEYQNQSSALSDVTTNFNSQIQCKNQKITVLKQELDKLTEEKIRELQSLKEILDQETARFKELIEQKNTNVITLQKKVDEYLEIESDLKNEIKCKLDIIDNLQKENEHLRMSVEELKTTDSNHKLILSEKLDMIENLQKEIEYANSQLELTQKEYTELQEKLAEKDDLILKLKYLIDELKKNIEDLKQKVESITNEKIELETKTSEDVQKLLDKISQLEKKLAESEVNRADLIKAQETLEIEKCEIINEKESIVKDLNQEQLRVNALNEEKLLLTKAIEEEKNLRHIVEQELQTLKAEKEDVMHRLNEEIKDLMSERKYISDLLNEEIQIKTNLFERLNEEIKAKDETHNENNTLSQQLQEELKTKATLLQEKEQIEHLLNKEIEQKNALVKEYETLSEQLLTTQTILQQKQISVQKLQDELSSKESEFVVEKDALAQRLDEVTVLNQAIIQEKESLNQQLNLAIENKNKVLEEKQSILQEFWEEKAAKILALQEIEAVSSAKASLEDEFKVKDEFTNSIIREKNDLEKEYKELNSLYNEVLTVNVDLKAETVRLSELLQKEEQLNNLLNNEICDNKAIQEVIVSDKELLGIEKEGLTISLTEEKSVKDLIETEKKTIREELCDVKKRLQLEIYEKQGEIEAITGELNQLKADFRKHEDLSGQIASLVNSNLHSLLENVKKLEISKEVLDSLANIEEANMTTLDECKVLINMVDTLTNEIMSRSNIETTLKEENAMLKGMAEIVKEKEWIMKEMQVNMKNLEETLEKCKAELSSQIEARELDEITKSKDIKNLQNINQSLTNQLNDVRYQLEVKVHLLNEKLVDKENLADEMKQSYELQIQNQNVMMEGLTESIKEKCVEIEELKARITELSSQTAARDHEATAKSEEIETMRNEIQSLTNQLNDVRYQLEVRVHAFKEKLVDQENLADEMKKSHELNIHNQKVMMEGLTECIKEKCAEIEKLETRIKELTMETEARQQEEIAKSKEIENLRNENQLLTNQLNDVRFQLEVKVHTLNEKLVDKENLADEMKKSYELQLQNQNVMMNGLTESIKERCVEIEELKARMQELKSVLKAREQEEIVKSKEIENLKNENQFLNNQLNDIKFQLEAKVHDLNEKLVDKENLADEMKKTYELQIQNQNVVIEKLTEGTKEKCVEIEELKANVTELSSEIEARKQDEIAKSKEIESLQNENQSITNKLNDVSYQFEVKVHALNEKLVEKENIADEMKQMYELQIQNQNVMIEKLTESIKERCVEIEELKSSKMKMQAVVEDSMKVINTLEEQTKSHEDRQAKLLKDFESERQVLKNMISVTESIMEDQKTDFNNIINELKKDLELLQQENAVIQKQIETERTLSEAAMKEKEAAINEMFKQLTDLKAEVDKMENNMKTDKKTLQEEVVSLKQQLNAKIKQLEEVQAEILRFKQELHAKETQIESLEAQNRELAMALRKYKDDVRALQDKEAELESMTDSLTLALFSELDQLAKVVNEDVNQNYKMKLKDTLQAKIESKFDIIERVKSLNSVIILLFKENVHLEKIKREHSLTIEKLRTDLQDLSKENERLCDKMEENEHEHETVQKKIKQEAEEAKKQLENAALEKLNLENKCSLLQEYQTIAEKELQSREKEINSLKERLDSNNNRGYKELHNKMSEYVTALKEKSELIKKLEEDKQNIAIELGKERMVRESCEKELEGKAATYLGLREKLQQVKTETGALRKENEEIMKSVGARDTLSAAVAYGNYSDKSHGEEYRDRHQVSTPTSDLAHSSMDSIKTISDLEKIIENKNRTITALQSDITFLKTLVAESETKLLDVNRELELSNENCQQLSSQLKKIVHQKNEEIAELKKQVNKMTATENRVSEIIKLSSKYQAIILRRIAEIKSNTVLKELTNFGNTSTDSELRRSLSSGGITMEDLENFLETTDKHLKRCAEKQLALQKERDRLAEVNKINESEILNLKKFLTELSLGFKTFNSVKEVYTQKLSKIVSIQRTVRREILNLDGTINDATMCKLERGYAAIMQDLAECSMNLERWVERSISRTISPEKIKQAFSCDNERSSLATTTFQNTSLEVQLDELENSFHKLLEEISRAQSGEGAKDAQAVTVMEVRAEYEDKLNRMKAKMKQLYQEQIGVFKEKQREEIIALERELRRTREKLAESSKAYEEHIKTLTTELWNVGEKFLMKKEEAEWLRKQRSGSLMSLQHLHSSGLHATHPEPSRPSDTHSLKSLPVAVKNEKRENRGLHMSDEEGEVFDNRCLKELATTPRRETIPGGQRLSELKWRNSLCPPHLKSSYPAETQFVNTLDEEDLKCTANGAGGGKTHRKEVGITAYKKPGPPTPSKQAGRLSATDSELRESLRSEPETSTTRKTSTPSRLRALFRSHRTSHDGAEVTPRTNRLSSIFRKKHRVPLAPED